MAKLGLDRIRVLIAAGTALIGKVGIDQTTPGTTNAVDIKTTGGATALDSTNKVPVSLYGKSVVAGDVPLKVDVLGFGMVIPRVSSQASSDNNANLLMRPISEAGVSIDFRVTPFVFNGLTFDRWRSNETATLLASAARTATVSSADQVNYNGRGVKVFINVTASADTPSITVAIETKDPVSGVYAALLTSAAITGAGHTVLTAYPGITAAANVAAAMVVGRTWRVTVTHADADSITYSVSATTLL